MSVLTVIYTGLKVEGSRSEFDAGFHSVTMSVGELRTIEFSFDSPGIFPEARLEVSLPDGLEAADSPGVRVAGKTVALRIGDNVLAFDVRAVSPGSGYLIGRVIGDEPIGLDRIFVTITAD
jgi:hypothetical protein